MTDDTQENVVDETADVGGNASEDAGKESSPVQSDAGEVKAESDKAKESADADAEKGKGDEEGDSDDSGEVEYSIDDFKLPEGVEADTDAFDEFLKITNNKELDGKERNQALIDFYAKKQAEAQDAQLQQWDNTRKEWQNQMKSDKEFGGKALDQTKALALKALTEYGSKELKEFGETYGWADHPEYLKMLARIGKTLSEDSSAKGKGENQTSIENRWYGSDDSN